MKINRLIPTLLLVAVVTLPLMNGCEKTTKIFSEGEYVSFLDTMAYYPVEIDEKGYPVEIAASSTRDYDRTFGVEIVSGGTTAIEGVNFTLSSNNIVIPAGERTGKIEILGKYDSMESSDSIGVELRLVVPRAADWDLYEGFLNTKVIFTKQCPQSVDNFLEDGGNFIFYASFPFSDYQVQRTLVKATKIDDERLQFSPLFDDTMPITMQFIQGDPLNPVVKVPEQEAFITSDYGIILCETASGYSNYFYSCDRVISFYLLFSSDRIGTFGVYYYALQWISEREAEYYRNAGFPDY